MKIEDLNNTLDKHLSHNKWDFLYQYATKSLDQDIERFHKLDDKISKFIAIVTVMISVFVAATPYIFKKHVPPVHPLEWLLVLLLFCTFIALCSVWSFLFRGLRLQNVPRLPLDEKLINFFKETDNINTIFFGLTKTCLKAFEENKGINADKVKHLNKAYDDTVYASFLVLADLFIVALLHVIK